MTLYTDNNYKNKLKIQLFQNDRREAEKRIKMYKSLQEVKNILGHPLVKDTIIDYQEEFLSFVLTKLYYESNLTAHSNYNITSTDNFLEFFRYIKLSVFPYAFKEEENLVLNYEAFKMIVDQLSKFDTKSLNLGINSVNAETINIDYHIENLLFDTTYELNNFFDLLLDISQIDENDSIVSDIFEPYIIRDCVINKTEIQNIYFVNEKSRIKIKHALIYLLLYKIPFDNKFLERLISFKQIDDEVLKKSTVIFSQNENLIELWKGIFNLRFRGFLLNKSDYFDIDNNLMFLNSFNLLANIHYPIIHNSIPIYNNGVYFQKKLLFKKKIIVVLQDYLSKLTEGESSKSKNNLLSISIKSNTQTNIQGEMYLGGLPLSNSTLQIVDYIKNNNKINILSMDPSDLQTIRKSFEDLIFDNLDIIETKEFYNSLHTPIIFHFEPSSEIITASSNVEINIISKNDIIHNRVFHPFFYRKDFAKQKQNLFHDSFVEFKKVCQVIIGSKLEGIIDISDELLMNKDVYVPVIDQNCIRIGNFLDISKIKLLKKTDIESKNVCFLKSNDVILSIKQLNNLGHPIISWNILPNIFDSSILGKEAFGLRAISERIKASEISSYLELLTESKLIYQLAYYFLSRKQQVV